MRLIEIDRKARIRAKKEAMKKAEEEIKREKAEEERAER